MKLSDYVFKFLSENGVKHVFTLSGGSCMHLTDSLGKNKDIKFITCHHEQACAMAVEAYAKFRCDLGASLVTSGPGSTNEITGVLGAYQDSVPCIFISGQAKSKQTVRFSGVPGLRQFGVQEVDIIPIVESITKYAVTIDDPLTIKYHLEKAVYLAKSGRPGPVWLDIPLDMQAKDIDVEALRGFSPTEVRADYKMEPTPEELESVLNLLAEAKRPVIIAGHGIRLSGANESLLKLVKKYNIPVITPFMGIDNIETDNTNYIGRIGGKGTRAGNFAMQNSDLIISIGSRLSVSVIGHEYELFAREAKRVVVDIDLNEHKKKTIKIDKIINSDAKLFLNGLFDLAEKKANFNFIEWLKICNGWKIKYPVVSPHQGVGKKLVDYYYFINELNKYSGSMPIVSDAGSSFYIVSQAISMKKGQRYITSGGLATMGFNLPAGIGVCVANGNNPVIVVTGDGSLQQNIQELQTIKHYDFPVKLFVVNNNGYLTIRETQKRFFSGNLVGESGTSGVSFPDTGKIADAYGIKYLKVKNNSDIDRVIQEAIRYKGPVICEVFSLLDQQVLPTNMSEIRPDGSMRSKPLEDMFPFLSREEFQENMFVKPIEK